MRMFTFHNINSRIYCKKTNTLSTMGSETNQLSGKMIVVRDQAIIGEKLIKDFIKPGDCRLMFDQQDLHMVLNNYRQMGYIDFDNFDFRLFENIIKDSFPSLNASEVLTIVLIIGGDKSEILEYVNKSILSIKGVKYLFAINNSLVQSNSIRVYFFDKTSKMNEEWTERLNEAVNAVSSSAEFESIEL